MIRLMFTAAFVAALVGGGYVIYKGVQENPEHVNAMAGKANELTVAVTETLVDGTKAIVVDAKNRAKVVADSVKSKAPALIDSTKARAAAVIDTVENRIADAAITELAEKKAAEAARKAGNLVDSVKQ